MCLTVNYFKSHVARKDIVCYKNVLLCPHVTEEYLGKDVVISFFGRSDKVVAKVDNVSYNVARLHVIGEHTMYNNSYYIDRIWCDGVEIEKKFFTPFRYHQIEIGTTYESELDYRSARGSVEMGLHSYKSKGPAKSNVNKSNVFTVKCVIPKGSTYYTGHFGHHRSYASNKLTYVELLS